MDSGAGTGDNAETTNGENSSVAADGAGGGGTLLHRLQLMPPMASGDRSAPWFSIAVGGLGGLILLLGVGVLGANYSQNWATFTVVTLTILAYLAELRAGRAVQAAATAIVAAGIPASVILVVTPIHTYNGIRIIELLILALLIAVFAVGGTRGRAIFLGLALFVAWGFAVSEAGHVQDTVNVIGRSFSPFFGESISSGAEINFDNTPDCEQFTFDDVTGDFVEDEACAQEWEEWSSSQDSSFSGNESFSQPRIDDHTFDIGIVSLLLANAYLAAYALLDRRGRGAIATACVLPGFYALYTAVIAFGVKWHSVWLAGLLAIAAGTVFGLIGNGRRRFTSWVGALGVAIGVGMVTADLAMKWFDSESELIVGLAWAIGGAVMIAVAVRLAPRFGDGRDGAPGTPDDSAAPDATSAPTGAPEQPDGDTSMWAPPSPA